MKIDKELAERISKIYSNVIEGQPLEEITAQEENDIETVIEELDQGKLRVVERDGEDQTVLIWVKEAILLYFRLKKMSLVQAGDLQFYDKIPLKKWTGKEGVRVVPTALARYGSYIESGAILMPSYINIGARVNSGTMVDTWATVGSCAQIGRNVHLSGGVGIGGVLEPLQARPVVIEDDVFVGSRSILVEGVHVKESAVIGAGVVITASTKIIDVTGDKEKIYQGYVPGHSVVIPGTLSKKFPAGEYGVSCALIIGKRKESTDKKTSLNQALRDFSVQV